MINDDVSLATMRWFRLAALVEGISFLLLLFIAMPFKYLGDEPRPVLYVGWMHGFLFVVYGLLLLKVWIQYRWSFKQAFLAFVASLVPFGTFVLDKRLKRSYFPNN
jgi:integral membrane protein